MKPRRILQVSLALNVLLGLALLLHAPKATPDASVPVVVPSTFETPVIAATGDVRNPAREAFRWSQIAGEDLKKYRENLLRLGCPELTMREILLAEINERFGPRRHALLAGLQNQFWNLDFILELANRKSAPRGDWLQPLLEMGAQRQQLIDAVLGPDRAAVGTDRLSRREQFRQTHAWLSQSKSDALFSVEEEHNQLLDKWTQSLSRRSDGVLTEQDTLRRQLIDRSFEDARQRILSPDEVQECRVRESSVADWAGNSPGFEVTEAEWRSVASRQLALQDTASSTGQENLTPEEEEARQTRLESQRQEIIRDVLGTNRFEQYQLANDGAYQAVRAVTGRYGLSDQVAAQAYEVQRAAENQAAQVRADPLLSEAQRQNALTAIAAETESNLGQALGAQALCTYKDYDGDWLTQLARADKGQ